MALKVLMLKKELDEKRKALTELENKMSEFEKRELDLEQAIQEANTEEEKATVEEAVENFENEKKEVEEEKASLEEKVNELENELKEEEKEVEAPQPEQEEKPEEIKEEERGKKQTMETRKFFNLTSQERDMFFAREDVNNYLNEVRSCIKEKRALTNVGLTIPEVFLGLIRQNIMDYSKLYKHVWVRQISGTGRAVVMGSIPEAVWTDCCANLNELSLVFNDLELDCWKVGGYFAVCNANLEDSMLNLASELIMAIGKAIGLALDKAILYGNGTRMPKGVVARLAETVQPADYPATARPWVDLHTTNILSIPANTKGADLIAALALDFGAAKGKYSKGAKVWAMNEATYTQLVAACVSVDAAGAIVSGVNGVMPVVGGNIEVLEFIPDNVIVAGYFDCYVLAERAGTQFATSEHVRFLNDQTVFKGTARYDGQPAIAEAFVAIGLNGVTPDATMNFAPITA